MTDRQLEAFLADKAVDEPDMDLFDAHVKPTPAIANATEAITRFAEHLALVMPPTDRIRYPPPQHSIVLTASQLRRL